MDIGLYQLKYPVRKLMAGILPFMREVHPNTVSLWLLPVGITIALCYYWAANGRPEFYLAAIALTFLRMFLGTLDGFIAEHYQKGTPKGEIINRLTPELCDVMYLVALTFSRPEWFPWGVGVLAVAWLTSFAGLIGLVVKRPIQSVGPVGQTDRLAALLILTLMAYFSDSFGWGIDFIKMFLLWSIIGGILTIALRLKRNLMLS